MADQDVWTIRAALEWTQGYLERKGDENPRVSAQWLLSEACGLSRVELFTNYEQPLSMDEREALRGYVTRRGTGEPLQYITGEVGFRHITVKVRPGVLIPRPETEVLVSEALATLPPLPVPCAADSRFEFEREEADEEGRAHAGEDDPSCAVDSGAREVLVADLCTGSGCIACSIAHEYPTARVFATDIAQEAIALAQDNTVQLGVSDRVAVIECDLGSGIPAERIGSFDLVVSNPPYIPSRVLSELPKEVSDFEPPLALDGGEDGLDFFRSIAQWSFGALAADGSLVVELHEDCLDEAVSIAGQQGFSGARIVHDLAGRPRILVATK